MYERTVAADQRIYAITLPGVGDYQTVRSLLSGSDLADLEAMEAQKSIIVDGYIVSSTSSFNVKHDPDGSGTLTFSTNDLFLCPMGNWINFTYVARVSGDGAATLRLFLSRKHPDYKIENQSGVII